MRYGLWLVLLLFGTVGMGQEIPSTEDFPSNYSSEPQGEFEEAPDTLSIYYFFADNPEEEYAFSDSTLNNYYHQFDPVRDRELDYAHLGNVGSAHRPIVYEPRFRQGFDIGFSQFDLYTTPAKDLRFYRIDRAYTNLGFNQIGSQSNTRTTAQFSRNFSGGVNLSLDYDRITLSGDQELFPRQLNRNTAFALGLWKHGRQGKYDGFFATAFNEIQQQDNGGIVSGPTEEEGFETPSSAQVFLDEAETQHVYRDLAYTQYLRLNRAGDSLAKENRRNYSLAHSIVYGSSEYKSFDEGVTADSAYYGPFLTDARGLRHFLRLQKVENDFRLRTFKLQEDSGTAAPRRQRDLLELGLKHGVYWLEQEPADSTVNNLFVYGRWHFQPGPGLDLETYAHFGLWNNAGDYRLNGKLSLGIGKLGNLTLEATNQLYEPSVLAQRAYISQRLLWNQDLKKTLETNLRGTYELPAFRLKLSGRYHLINNYVYFDTLGLARQMGTPISILQLVLQKNIKLGAFHLDNTVAAQFASEEDILRLPQLFGKHSLYYRGFWFETLHIRIGLDLRYNTDYFADTYLPIIGQFTLQNEREVEFYPAVDGYLSMRVGRFRAFFKWENATNLLLSDRLFYQTGLYPHPTGSGLRFGIKWRFVD